MDSDRLKMFLDNCYQLVQRNGWMIQGVLTAKGDPWETPFYYTTGLTLHKLPELVLSCALDPSIAQDMLNQLARQLLGLPIGAAPGMTLKFEQPHSELMPVMPVRLVAMDPDWIREHVTLPRRLGFGEPQALQVLWPDRDGRFPGDPDYSMAPEVQRTFPPVK